MVITCMFACTKEDPEFDPDNLLTGVWNFSSYQDDAIIFTRSQLFSDNHCYRFNSDGTLVERKNSGWCGTPPISYSDYPGTWEPLNDTTLVISAGYWGGTISYQLDIELLTEDYLKVIAIPE